MDILRILKNARWGNEDDINNVVCPHCKQDHHAYFISTRCHWQCKHCKHRFSITSGTIFHLTKLTLRQILTALYYFATKSKGISAIELSHLLNVQYVTAWKLLHRFRESLNYTKDLSELQGEIHVDGCYVNTYIRPKNLKYKRIDRRAKRYQRKDKACLLVYRQKATNLQGADRSIVALVKEENADDIWDLTHKLVASYSHLCTDEHLAYSPLQWDFRLHQVNHSLSYRAIDGTTNNLAESFFARFRRMQKGIHHKLSNKYMMLYANEIAWREDNRRKTDKEKFTDLMQRCLSTPPLCHFFKNLTVKFGLDSLTASNYLHYFAAA